MPDSDPRPPSRLDQALAALRILTGLGLLVFVVVTEAQWNPWLAGVLLLVIFAVDAAQVSEFFAIIFGRRSNGSDKKKGPPSA